MPCGLARIEFDGSDRCVDAADRAARTITRTVFDSADGVRSSASAGFPSARRSPSRQMADCGSSASATASASSIRDTFPSTQLPPPVHVEQIVADRKPYDVGTRVAIRRLTLPALTRDLQIDYTAFSLVAPEKVRFRYKLEGNDRDWQDVGNRRQAFYTNLRPAQLPLPRHGEQQQRCVERNRRVSGFLGGAGVLPDDVVFGALDHRADRTRLGRPSRPAPHRREARAGDQRAQRAADEGAGAGADSHCRRAARRCDAGHVGGHDDARDREAPDPRQIRTRRRRSTRRSRN